MKKYISRLLLVLSIFTFANMQFAHAETYPELCEVFNRTLKYGDTGTDVKRLQVVMGQEGIAYLSSTGYYGNGTVAAVKTFQTRNGIYPAGKVGPQTLRFMRNLWCFGEAPNNTNPNNTYIPINTNNPELPASGWNNGGSNWNNSGTPEISLQPVSSSANNITISWNTRAMNSCSIQQDGGNFQNLQSSTGQQIFTLYGEARFTLKCMGYNGREYSKTILVRPNQAISNLPTVNVSINPSQILIGQQATLYWTSSNTSYCTSNVPGNTSNLQSSGSLPVTISANSQSFTFTCYSQSGQSVSQTINSTTAPNTQATIPVINNFTYSNNYLAWGTINANSCIISGGNLNNVSVQTSGNYPIPTPTTNTTWTLTCYGNNNQTATRQVNYNSTNTNIPTVTVTPQTVNIISGQSTALNLSTTNVNTCTVNGGIYTNQSLILSNNSVSISVNPTVNTNYVFTCIGTNNQSVSATAVVTVNGTTTGVPTVTLTPTTQNVTAGQAATLNWNSANTTYCRFKDQAGNILNSTIVGAGYSTQYPQTSMTYTINCTGTNGQSVSATATVTVNGNTSTNLPTVNMYAYPTNVTSAGQSSTLTWSSTNASYCSITGGNVNLTNQSSSGSYTVYPSVSTNYQINCYNNNGQNIAGYAYVTVTNNTNNNPTAQVTPTTSTINAGQTQLLQLANTNTNYCYMTGGTYANAYVGSNGNISVTPNVTTTYTFTCYGTNNTTVTTTAVITVNAINTNGSVTVSPNTVSINSGSNTTLTLTKTNVDTCTITGGTYNNFSLGTSNTITVTPTQTTIYTFNCTGSNGVTASNTATVTVISTLPQLTLNPENKNILYGELVTITITKQNITSCTIQGGVYTTATNIGSIDSIVVNPTQTTTYTFSCLGNNNTTVTKSSIITVNSVPTITVNASPSSTIVSGNSATVNLTRVNTTACTINGGGYTNASLSNSTTSMALSPTVTTTYTFNCTGVNSQTANTTLIITVVAAPTITVTPYTQTISSGQVVTFSLNKTNISTCSINSQNIGALSVWNVNPTVTTTYNFNCIGTTGTNVSTSSLIIVQ